MNVARKPVGFFIAVVLLHVVYFMAALYFGRIYNGDSFEYIYEAVNIKDHFFFYSANPVLPITEEYMTLRTPGYPLFICGVYLFSINNWIILLLQNIASVFNVFHVRKTFVMMGYSSKYDLYFFLLLLLFPSQLVYANVMAPDVLLQTCTVLYFRYTIIFLKNKTANAALKMSIALVAGLFIKPILYPFAAIHFLIIIIYSFVKRIEMKQVLLAGLFPLLCIVSYNYINKIRTGKFHFSSIQSFNAIYYYQRFYSDKVSMEKGKEYIDRERAEIAKLPDFSERYDRANERGITLLKENFLPYMVYHLSKSFMFFLETGRGELDEFTGRMTLGKVYAGKSKKFTTVLKENNFSEVMNYLKHNITAVFALFVLLANVIKIIGVLLFMIRVNIQTIIKWFIGLFILYFALITGPIANAHYVMPVSLIIMCCALTGYYVAFNKASSNKNLTYL